jgi:predicted MFS family arabinose efflux permease
VTTTETNMQTPPPQTASPWSPFRHNVFALLWTGIVISNVGTWMHDVAAGWLMTTLTSSPVLVASVQAATTLPVFLFALPAGALADIVDRRRLIVGIKIALCLTAAVLGAVVILDAISPVWLLLFTLAMGTGAAFIAPAWQAIIPQLVPRAELQQAIALNSVGINISRAIGPAVGGLLMVAVGIWAPFVINAVSFLFVIAILIWWTPDTKEDNHLPGERFFTAMRAGLRYAKSSQPLRSTLIRASGFFIFATCYWALLPLIARDLLRGGASYYGYLMGGIGLGAVLAALALPMLRTRLGANRVVALGSLGTALVLVIFAVSKNQILGVLASMLAGAAWLTVLSTLNVAAQIALPEWVRARGLSVMIAVYFGSMAGASVVWGNLADIWGIPTALLLAAAGAFFAIPATWRWKLPEDANIDLTPTMHWTVPNVAEDVEDDRGPVMVTVEYKIDPANAEPFLAAMKDYGETRKRDGAYAWGIFEDIEEPGTYVEYFLVESWLEHERQHHRVTEADISIEQNALQYTLQPERPRARHLVAPPSRKPG